MDPVLLIPGTLFLLLAVGVIARAVFVPSAMRGRATCGACGHECAEPLTDRCPECGGAYTRVGVVTRAMAMRLRGGLLPALVAWTAICGCVAIVVWNVARRQAWRSATAASATNSAIISTYTLHPFAGSGPGAFDPNRLDYRVMVTHRESLSDGVAVTREMSFELRRAGSSRRAIFDLVLGGMYSPSRPGADALLICGTQFTESSARAMFDAVELDTADAVVERSLASFTAMVRQAVLDPKSLDEVRVDADDTAAMGEMRVVKHAPTVSAANFVRGGRAIVVRPLWTIPWVVVTAGVLVFVYVIGAAEIVRRRRRLLAPRPQTK